MKQVMSKRLPHTMENVCLSTDEECQLYAVGSKAHTDLLDSRTLQPVRKIPSRNSGCGIRSVSFKGNILTIGQSVTTPPAQSPHYNPILFRNWHRTDALLGPQGGQISRVHHELQQSCPSQGIAGLGEEGRPLHGPLPEPEVLARHLHSLLRLQWNPTVRCWGSSAVWTGGKLHRSLAVKLLMAPNA